MADLNKYANIRGSNAGYDVHLDIGHQHFCVTPVPYATREEAEWMRKRLVKALEKMMAEIRASGGG